MMHTEKPKLFRAVFLLVALPFIPFEAGLTQGDRIYFDRISVAQGLAENNVICGMQDRQGFLWFGTLDGLDRFDGYEFRHYRVDLPDVSSPTYNYITTIYEDRAGHLWVGTDAELLQFDRDSESFRRFDLKVISALVEDDSSWLWIGTVASGLFRLKVAEHRLEHFQHDPADPNSLGGNWVSSLCKMEDGTLLVGLFGAGLARFDPVSRQFQHFRHDPADPKSLRSDRVTALCRTNDSQVWVGTVKGLDWLDLTDNKVRHLSDDYVNSLLFQEGADILWVGTRFHGLGKWSRAEPNAGITYYGHQQDDPRSLSSNNITTIFRDRAGIFWVGTRGGGIDKFDPHALRFLHFKHEPNRPSSLVQNKVWSFWEDDEENLWVGTADGVSVLHGQATPGAAFTNYPPNAGPMIPPAAPVRAMCEDGEGRMWFCTIEEGLVKYDKRTRQTTVYKPDAEDPTSLPTNHLYAMRLDRSGQLWIGANGGGLSQVVPKEDGGIECTVYDFDGDGHAPYCWVIAIHESQQEPHTLWLGTWAHGLIKFDTKSRTFRQYKHDPGNPSSLSSNTILSIFEDREHILWVGTLGAGLNKLIETNAPSTQKQVAAKDLVLPENGAETAREQQVSFVHYQVEDGLPSNVICGILQDEAGYLWLSTFAGVGRLDPKTGYCVNYGMDEGLQSSEFNVGAAYKRKNGELLFGGINGFNSFRPDPQGAGPAPEVVLTGFKKFGQSVPLGRAPSEIHRIELSYKDAFLTFEFAALDYRTPHKNIYAYFLEGFDQSWHYSGTKHEATYTNLDPGEYTFRVKAANSLGTWNNDGLAVDIFISPPFWQKWWFILFSVAAVLTAVLHTHRIRLKQALKIQRAKEEEREQVQLQMAGDLHDELGRHITAISLANKILDESLQKPTPRVKKCLDTIRDSTVSLFSDFRAFLWHLNVEQDSAHDLVVQLVTFSESILELSNIAFKVVGLSNRLKRARLPGPWRLQLLRLFQEAINNIVKHVPDCRQVQLEIRVDKGWLHLTLRNDGRGFDPDRDLPGYGLKNMRKRAHSIGGTLEIKSKNHESTEISFHGKLPEGAVDSE